VRSTRSGFAAMVSGAAIAALAAGSLATSGAQAQPVPTAANPFNPAYGHPYRHGVLPTVSQLAKMKAYASSHGEATSQQTVAYGGGIGGIGVTSGTPKVYLVFWGSQWGIKGTNSSGELTFSKDSYHGAPYIQSLFKGLGTDGERWSGTMTQYCDGSSVKTGATSCPAGAPKVGYPTGGDLTGVWYDNSAAEPEAATGHAIGVEAVKAAGHFGNTTSASNRYAQYVILSAPGLNPDQYMTQGFCSWHDYNGDKTLDGGGAVHSPYGDIAFTNLPYVMNVGSSCGAGFVNYPGLLDGYSIVAGHEYAETLTDQNPRGGWSNHQDNSYLGEEVADECAWISFGQGAASNVKMATGTFAMQSIWSNDTNKCSISHPIV
jgi:hypothetical protein